MDSSARAEGAGRACIRYQALGLPHLPAGVELGISAAVESDCCSQDPEIEADELRVPGAIPSPPTDDVGHRDPA